MSKKNKNKLSKRQKQMWDTLKYGPVRKISGTWTIKDSDTITSLFGIDVEQEIDDIIAKEIAKEIDAEILKSLL